MFKEHGEGDGGGLVVKSWSTLRTSWTVACQASLCLGNWITNVISSELVLCQLVTTETLISTNLLKCASNQVTFGAHRIMVAVFYMAEFRGICRLRASEA